MQTLRFHLKTTDAVQKQDNGATEVARSIHAQFPFEKTQLGAKKRTGFFFSAQGVPSFALKIAIPGIDGHLFFKPSPSLVLRACSEYAPAPPPPSGRTRSSSPLSTV